MMAKLCPLWNLLAVSASMKQNKKRGISTMKMKRLTCTILAVVLLASLASPALAVTMGVVRMTSGSGSVYLRTGPGVSYNAIGYANHGDLLQIRSEGRYWDRVTLKSGVNKGMTGYMYNKYITNLRDIEDISGWGALAHIKTKYATSTVNLRRGPSTRYASIENLPSNAMLIVLDKYNSRWYEVQVVNSLRTGYVYSQYIANGIEGYTTANVNLRRSASDSSKVLDVIPNGTAVRVYTVGKNWSRVRYDGMTGYVYNGYLRLF